MLINGFLFSLALRDYQVMLKNIQIEGKLHHVYVNLKHMTYLNVKIIFVCL